MLSLVGKIVEANCRTEDIPIRYGGDEFCLIAPEIEMDQALIPAERLRRAIEKLGRDPQFGNVHLTASFGIASFNGVDAFASEVELMRAADDSCYEAKRRGRNCICCYRAGKIVLVGAKDVANA